jgi:hypothetical protein
MSHERDPHDPSQSGASQPGQPSTGADTLELGSPVHFISSSQLQGQPAIIITLAIQRSRLCLVGMFIQLRKGPNDCMPYTNSDQIFTSTWKVWVPTTVNKKE